VSSLIKAGRYELLDELGRGAMGVVYRAKDPVIGRDVAVKTIRLVEAATGLTRAELVSRFQTEARAAGLLTHPNIVVIYDAGEEDGQFYITMELVEGSSLQALLDQGQSFPLPRVLRLMEQACSALEFAHLRLVVHRDIKPANLMLTQDDQLKITDFGTAKILQMGATMTATVIGTPSYMSPEQIKGSPVDGRSDIFALGVILYELVTGQKPFPGENVTTVIYRIVNEEPIPPRQIDSSIHPGLAAVITRALAKDPAERFESCRDMSQALQNYQRAGSGLPTVRPPSRAPFPAVIPTNTTERTQRLAPRPANPTPAPEPIEFETVTWQPEQRKPKSHAFLTLVLLAMIAVGGFRAWPVLLDFWQTGVQPALASRLAAIEGKARPSHTPLPASAPASALPKSPAPIAGTGTPTHASSEAPSAPADSQSVTQALTPADTSIAPVAPAPSTQRADSEPKPTAAADAAEKQIAAYLAGANLADTVQIHAAGDTLTLSGKLTSEEYRDLMANLRDLPAGVRVIDHIEFAGDSPEASAATAIPARVSATTPHSGATPGASPGAAASTTPGSNTVPPLTVTSQPAGADIFVNGQRQYSQTPAKIDLPAGRYLIAVRKQGFELYASQVEIKAGEPAQFDADLTPLPQGQGWVVARTVPRGASITVDGVATNQQTPAKLDLAAGQHVILFSLAGYTAESSVIVHPGRGLQIFQVLDRP